jgi:DNA-binding NarL/FixJ family response regulator
MSSAERIALIADDDELVRLALVGVVTKQLGFSHVIEAGSLDEALQRLGENSGISLALFDLRMPGMESAASLGAVRDCFPDLRVAVVSASTRREDILLALWAGVHGYVPKNLGVQDLSRALASILDGVVYVPACLAEVTPHGRVALPPSMTRPSAVTESGTPGLTPRQHEILQLLVDGRTNKEIARALDLSIGTVKIHLAAVFRALGVTTRAAAAAAVAKRLSN